MDSGEVDGVSGSQADGSEATPAPEPPPPSSGTSPPPPPGSPAPPWSPPAPPPSYPYPPPPPPPGQGAGFPLGGWLVAAAVVVVLGLVAFAVTRDDEEASDGGGRRTRPTGDRPTTTVEDVLSSAEDPGRVELVTAARPLVEALEAETTAAVLTVLDAPGVPDDQRDVPGTRAATDAALADLQAVVADGGAEGAPYQSAFEALDGLATLRGDVDSLEPGSGPSAAEQLYVIDRDYRGFALALVDAAEEVAWTVEGSDLSVGAQLFTLGLRQRLTTAALLAEISRASSSGPTLDDREELKTVSTLWSDYQSHMDLVRTEAAGTGYEVAAGQLEEQLDRVGYLAGVPALLEGGTIDIAPLVESTSLLPPEQGWPGFVTAVEAILTS